ncbi:MAG: polyisoprenoid-binding protein [Burkholderiales bacterium]|nr:polyisoprenoid-binding protein [Burkholderiales bacterium]
MLSLKSLFAGLAAVLTAVLAGAAAPALAQPVSYTLDPDHTVPRFEIDHNGLSFHTGAFMRAAGKAVLDSFARTGSVEVTIQTASFTSGHAFMEGVVKGKDFFNVEQFPTMTYKSTAMRYFGDAPATVEGNLTLLGVTRPVTLRFTRFTCGQHPRTKREQCGGNLSGTLKRSDFGMKAFLPAIGDEVRLNIQVEGFKD